MKRPKIQDKEVEKYVKYLEDKLDSFSANTILAKSYLALSKFVEEANKVLTTVTINTKNFSDKDDKLVERAQKFADKIGGYNDDLKKMEDKLTPQQLEAVKQKQAGSLYEAASLQSDK